jgi:hypothetical protein
LKQAKGAAALGKAGFDDQLTLLLHFGRSQQWERAFEHLSAAERLAAGKPGMRFVRDALLEAARRHEDLRKRLLAEAAALAAAPESDREALPQAAYLLEQARRVFAAHEMPGIRDTLRPVYARAPEHVAAMKRWTVDHAHLLRRLARDQEALALLASLAEAHVYDPNVQRQYADALRNAGREADAYTALRAAMERPKWEGGELDGLRGRYADMLNDDGRIPDLLAFTTGWIGAEPTEANGYQRHLSALVRMDRIDEARALARRWLAEARAAEPLT